MMVRWLSCRRAAGFTLVEMIVVIVLTGIVAGMVAVFIRSPVEAYVDTARRARLTEAADTALRRLARDLRSALPNSVRVTGVGAVNTVWHLEFIPTVGGGRYRDFPTAAGGGDVLDFTQADAAFDVLGPVPVYAAGDSVVIFNLEPGSAADAYAGNNRAAVTSSNNNAALLSSDAARHTVALNPATWFPAPSTSGRFHLVAAPVSYTCDPGAGTLLRRTGYGFQAAQPTPPNVAGQVLVDRVVACTLTYNPAATATTRTGLLIVALTLADPVQPAEQVRLVHQIHIQNQP